MTLLPVSSVPLAFLPFHLSVGGGKKTSLKNDIGLCTCPLPYDSWHIHSCGCQICRSPSLFLLLLLLLLIFPLLFVAAWQFKKPIWYWYPCCLLLSNNISSHLLNVCADEKQSRWTKSKEAGQTFPLSLSSLSFSLSRSLSTNLTSFFGYPSVLTDDWSGYRRSVGLPGPCSFPSWWVRHGSAF